MFIYCESAQWFKASGGAGAAQVGWGRGGLWDSLCPGLGALQVDCPWRGSRSRRCPHCERPASISLPWERQLVAGHDTSPAQKVAVLWVLSLHFKTAQWIVASRPRGMT